MTWQKQKSDPNQSIDPYVCAVQAQIAVFQDYHFHKYETTN